MYTPLKYYGVEVHSSLRRNDYFKVPQMLIERKTSINCGCSFLSKPTVNWLPCLQKNKKRQRRLTSSITPSPQELTWPYVGQWHTASLGIITLSRYGRGQAATPASLLWTVVHRRTRNSSSSSMRRATRTILRPFHLQRFTCTVAGRACKMDHELTWCMFPLSLSRFGRRSIWAWMSFFHLVFVFQT